MLNKAPFDCRTCEPVCSSFLCRKALIRLQLDEHTTDGLIMEVNAMAVLSQYGEKRKRSCNKVRHTELQSSCV